MNERKDFRRCAVQRSGVQCLKAAGHEPQCQFEDGAASLEEAEKQGLQIEVGPGVDALGIIVVRLTKQSTRIKLAKDAIVVIAYDESKIKVTKSKYSDPGEGIECMTEAVRRAGGKVTFSVGRITISVPEK